jgi:RNA 2',3'-cyclic 3'-phosphodiesterase
VPAGQSTIRAFVAIAIPEQQRAALAEYTAACRQLAPHYSWVPGPNLHLTLRFLGNLPPATLEAVRQSLSSVRRPAFKLGIGGLGTFGSRRAPRVIWLGLRQGQEEITDLAEAVEQACRAGGLPPADHAFQPHLTLARMRKAYATLPPLPDPPPLDPWDAAEFLLFQSVLARPHPTYTPLESVPLR